MSKTIITLLKRSPSKSGIDYYAFIQHFHRIKPPNTSKLVRFANDGVNRTSPFFRHILIRKTVNRQISQVVSPHEYADEVRVHQTARFFYKK